MKFGENKTFSRVISKENQGFSGILQVESIFVEMSGGRMG